MLRVPNNVIDNLSDTTYEPIEKCLYMDNYRLLCNKTTIIARDRNVRTSTRYTYLSVNIFSKIPGYVNYAFLLKMVAAHRAVLVA